MDGYDLIRELGTGATGSVYLAEKNGSRAALKVLCQAECRDYGRLHKNMQIEVDALRNLNHPNIMRILDAKLDVDYVDQNGRQQFGDYIASEVLSNGELFDFVDGGQGGPSGFSEPVAKQLFLQMIAGLTYMHHQGIVNRDIKLENMLVADDFTIKIADFGFAKPMEGQGDGQIATYLGTPGYMAPEIIEGRMYSGQAVDMFALGIVLFSMVTVSSPFAGLDRVTGGQTMIAADKLYHLFCTNKQAYWGRYAQLGLSEEFKSLIDAMLNPSPEQRPGYSDLIVHPWLVSANDECTLEQCQQDMASRKGMREENNQSVDMQSNHSARESVRRDTQLGGNMQYVLGPLTEEQKSDPNVKQLSLNTYSGAKVPGSFLLHSENSAAADLFLWIKQILLSSSGVEEPTVDDNVWKLNYKISKTQEPNFDLDDELLELLFENEAQSNTTSASISLEILKVEGEEGKHVLEFIRKEGSPDCFRDHAQQLGQQMLQKDGETAQNGEQENVQAQGAQ